MIKLEQLDQLKLISDETVYADDKRLDDRLEIAILQGAGGWGVRTEDAVILRLARDLKLALHLAEKADEAQRTLKGLQLENGRLRKARDNAQDAATAQTARIVELEDAFNDLQRTRDLTSEDS